ncbi:unnamed protein product [Candida verbasci]|uniref:Nucleotide exchange factor SIL1 n=1 Tax=Candida verbasci TaxID=1227364 RepID=A0A9W4TRN7_9ASCO|nr:unnamed protein product [Candida verbasci]
MRFGFTILLQIVLSLSLSNCSILNSRNTLICNPNNTTDCYPKLFKPTKDWQIIKPNQEIPPGLHVRLNIATLEKEAKIMDKEESENSIDDLVIKEDKVIDHNDLNERVSKSKRSKVDQNELTNFHNAAEEVEFNDGDTERLQLSLNTLEELSHDFEFGNKITSNTTLLIKMIQLSKESPNFKDQIYRIIASSLRNNPNSVRNLIQNLDQEFIDTLFQELPNSNSIIQKRILGIFQALIQLQDFKNTYFNPNGKGINELIKIYPSLPNDSKIRVENIFQDLGLINNIEKREDENPDHSISNYLQNRIISTDDLKYYETLVNLHKTNKNLKPIDEFLQWLTKRLETSKNDKKRSDNDDNYNYLLTTRHEIFGNPMGMRKALADEL